MSGTTPKDPYNFVLGLMYYLAIGTLLPWNFFISVPGKGRMEDWKARNVLDG